MKRLLDLFRRLFRRSRTESVEDQMAALRRELERRLDADEAARRRWGDDG